MAETEPQLRLIRFGNFEVDLRSGELRKAGVKQKFGGHPFQVLSILLERPGDVVTREELQKRLWPDTFVDVDHNLNTAINKIREVLGDSAESPRFVETLPRRGYRFIGALEPHVPTVVSVEPIRNSQSHQRWLKIAAGIVAISVLALGAVVAYRWSRPPVTQEQQTTLNALPFTTFPGEETSPVFSPDGSRIAFAWNGDPASGGKGFDLYVKAIGSETLLRLTQHPSELISAAWSPDGTQIAFHRMAGTDSGIYLVPALGGPERKLRSTRPSWASMISWSPDGRLIAFSDLLQETELERIYLLSTETWETKRIPSVPECRAEGLPAFSHDGKYLAYWCYRSMNEWGLYSLPLLGSQSRMISLLRDVPRGLTWSADDKRIIYSRENGGERELGEVSVADGSVKRLTFAGSAELPTVSPKGDRLAFSSSSNSSTINSTIWRRDLLHPESPPSEFIPSTRGQDNAQYSPDGKRVAFASIRSGVLGIWVSSADGSNLVQISNPLVESGSPQWSPDGQKVAFDSRPVDRWELYVADVSERIPRRLVTNLSDVYRPRWSRDGKWIYFRSDQVGRMGIYRCPSSGGDAVSLSKDVDVGSPQESADGATVYFAGGKGVLKKVPLVLGQPGAETQVDGFPRLGYPWTLSSDGVYFAPAEAPRSIRYFDFATKQVRKVMEVDKDFGDGLSVSPDGRWILYTQIGDLNSDIMLVDHFR